MPKFELLPLIKARVVHSITSAIKNMTNDLRKALSVGLNKSSSEIFIIFLLVEVILCQIFALVELNIRSCLHKIIKHDIN